MICSFTCIKKTELCIKRILLLILNDVDNIISAAKLKMAPQTPIPKAESVEETNIKEDKEGPPSMQIVWRNVAIMSYLHLAAIYGLFLLPSSHILTWAWSSFCFFASGLGVTAGAHRLWSHRSFKATWPLRAALMVLNCMAVQNDIYEWTRDHRVHHKFTETDADPHNAKRGFFFSHIGWLMVKKHPDVKRLGKKVDLRDLEEDKIVMFQKRYGEICYCCASLICSATGVLSLATGVLLSIIGVLLSETGVLL